MVRTISLLKPPPLRRSTVIRVGAVVAVRGCFGEDACMDDDEGMFAV